MRFFLGTHHPHWLADARFVDVMLGLATMRTELLALLEDVTTECAAMAAGGV